MNQRLASLFGAPIRSQLIDRGIVVLIFAFGAVAAIALRAPGVAPVTHPLGLLLSVSALLFRHRRPVATLAFILVVTFVVNYAPVVMLPSLLALFTVTTECEPPSIIAGALATTIVLLLTPDLHGRAEWGYQQIISRVVVVGLVVAFGLYLRARAAYINELKERALRLERERELDAARAVAEERVRIARELHDVVAHNVSLMVVQTQAAAAAAASPDGGNGTALQATLSRVGNLGRDALSEMHRMLGVLRVGDASAAERRPQPGVGDLATLIATTAETGLETDLTVTGESYELPAGVDLSAYRIVQEALTNVVRHARASHATVELQYGRDGLELTICDDGIGDTLGASAPGSSHGLIGMRERVSLFGGCLSTGYGPGRRGYRVQASLPVSSAPRRPDDAPGTAVTGPGTADTAALISAIVKRVS